MKRIAVLLLAVSLAAACLAQSPVGKWKGKLKIDRAGIPKAKTPQQEKQMKQMLSQVEMLTFLLDMRSNKTFVVDVPSFSGQKPQKAEGTWSQSGKVITLVTTKQDGKPAKERSPQKMTIQPGGRKMTLLAGSGPQKAEITFVR